MEQQPNLKKIFVYSFAGVLLVVLLIWLWHYLHSGRIVITTDNPYGSITLSMLNEKDGSFSSKVISKAKTKLTANVSTGDYYASVVSNSQETIQVINIKSHKTLSYHINPVNAVGVEPVVYESGDDISASSQKLFYIDTTNGYLSGVDSKNSISIQNSSVSFQTIDWSNSFFGVGQTDGGHLYVIDTGKVSPLNVPFSYDDSSGGEDSDVSFAVAPNRNIIVSDGGVVYAGNQSSGFKQVYKTSASDLALAAGAKYIAATGESSDTGEGSKKSELTILSTYAYNKVANTNVPTVGSGETDAMAWSPNNNYLTFPAKSGLVIYDSNLQQVALLPVEPDGVVWSDNNTFFYSYNDELWRYNLSDQKAELIANMPLGSLITDLSLSSDNSYAYLATASSGSGSSSAIRRVGIKGQATAESIYQLQSILPLDVGSCSLSLVNFTKPTILVTSTDDQSQQCLQNAKAELKSRGFSLNSLQFSAAL